MAWRDVYLIAYLVFCFFTVRILARELPKIGKIIDPGGKSPRDVADFLSRMVILVFLFLIFVAVLMLKKIGVSTDGLISTLLFMVAGYTMGMFVPSPLPSVIEKLSSNRNQS